MKTWKQKHKTVHIIVQTLYLVSTILMNER